MRNLTFITAMSVLVFSACSPADIEAETTPTLAASAQAAEEKTEPAKEVKQEEAKTQYALTTSDLGSGVYMLAGSGGNIGLSTGPDGAFVIDDQFARFSGAILTEIAGLSSDAPIKFVVNTHYHGDHTGGNAAMKETGASIVAHKNVRARMGETFDNKLWGRKVEATDPSMWPTVTFEESMTFYFNNQSVDVMHVANAHTDGDAIVYFREADVLHMGDNFFNGMFPYIDVDSGGSVDGMIAALDAGLAKSGPKTQIMPGHGPVSSKADMKAARDMLADVQNRVKTKIDAGDSLQSIVDSGLLKDYSDLASFINEENMIKITYRSLTGRLE